MFAEVMYWKSETKKPYMFAEVMYWKSKNKKPYMLAEVMYWKSKNKNPICLLKWCIEVYVTAQHQKAVLDLAYLHSVYIQDPNVEHVTNWEQQHCKVINYVQCFMYCLWAYFFFILFIAIDWDNKINSLLRVYVLMVNNSKFICHPHCVNLVIRY